MNVTSEIRQDLLTYEQFMIIEGTVNVFTVLVSVFGIFSNMVDFVTLLSMGFQDGLALSMIFLAFVQLLHVVAMFARGIAFVYHIAEYACRFLNWFPLRPLLKLMAIIPQFDPKVNSTRSSLWISPDRESSELKRKQDQSPQRERAAGHSADGANLHRDHLLRHAGNSHQLLRDPLVNFRTDDAAGKLLLDPNRRQPFVSDCKLQRGVCHPLEVQQPVQKTLLSGQEGES
ncbi:hypothetical protein Btru_071480 [Bulinus truncatus]|nr:hypothetical protein Btru_071480 [Bulinus truncatus]